MALRRLRKELKDIENYGTGCRSWAGPIGEDLFKWNGCIYGPVGSPYDGGKFYLDIYFPQDYPFKPPKIKFKTKIYHCNINDKGGICLDILKDNWSPALTITKVLISITNLITDPNVGDPLQPDIAKLYQMNRKLHDKKAKEWTKKYANPADTPSLAELKKVKYKYDPKTQTIECNVWIKHPTYYGEYREHIKYTKFIVEDYATKYVEGKLNAVEEKYTFEFNKEIEYGSILTVRSEIQFESPDISKIMSGSSGTRRDNIFVDMLSKDQYKMLIDGYLKGINVEYNDYPMDIVNICFAFYYKFVVIYKFEDKETKVTLLDNNEVFRYSNMKRDEYKSRLYDILEIGNCYGLYTKYRLQIIGVSDSINNFPIVVTAKYDIPYSGWFTGYYNGRKEDFMLTKGSNGYSIDSVKSTIKDQYQLDVNIENIKIEMKTDGTVIQNDEDVVEHLVGHYKEIQSFTISIQQ